MYMCLNVKVFLLNYQTNKLLIQFESITPDAQRRDAHAFDVVKQILTTT